VKRSEEIVEILEGYDLTGSYRAADRRVLDSARHSAAGDQASPAHHRFARGSARG